MLEEDGFGIVKSIEAAMDDDHLFFVCVSHSDCSACQRAAPLIEQLRAGLAGTATFFEIYGDKVPAVIEAFGISAFPTLLAIKGSDAIAELVGLESVTRVNALLSVVNLPPLVAASCGEPITR